MDQTVRRASAHPGAITRNTLREQGRRLLLYSAFGTLTFVVNVAVYALCERRLGLDALTADAVAWVFAVLFAFFTNRRWVFDGASGDPLWRQLLSFSGGRLFTLGVEELMLYGFVTRRGLDGVTVKLAAQVIVVTLNYMISRFLVFRPEKN